MSLYLDLLGVLSIVLLFNNVNIEFIAIIALLADIIGYRYMGSHLLAIVLMSFISRYFYTFYNICNAFQKIFLIIITYSIFVLILYLVGLLLHNNRLDPSSYALELITIPIIYWLYNSIFLENTD